MLTVTPAAGHCTVDDDCGNFSEYDGTVKIARCNQTVSLCECILPLCYHYNINTNQCELKHCHTTFLSNNGKAIGCVNQGPKHKNTALYLNIISFTGATNFYLKNYALGAGQLLLFIMLLATCCLTLCSCCLWCVALYGRQHTEETWGRHHCCCCDTGKYKRKIASTVSATKVLLILLSLGELIWMIHDFIKIALNGMLDADGCFLSDDTVALIQDIAITTLEFGN